MSYKFIIGFFIFFSLVIGIPVSSGNPDCPSGTKWDSAQDGCIMTIIEGCPSGYHTDTDGSCISDTPVTVEKPCSAGGSWEWRSTASCVPNSDGSQKCEIKNTVTETGDLKIKSLLLDYGDGTPPEEVQKEGSVIHTYTKPGCYNPIMTITDQCGTKQSSPYSGDPTCVCENGLIYDDSRCIPPPTIFTPTPTKTPPRVVVIKITQALKPVTPLSFIETQTRPPKVTPTQKRIIKTPVVTKKPETPTLSVTHTVQPTKSTIRGSYTPKVGSTLSISSLVPIAKGIFNPPNGGTVPLQVAFMDQSTRNPTSWNWNFGDNETSSEQNPTHIYTKPGKYKLSIEACNEYGCKTGKNNVYISVCDAGSILDNKKLKCVIVSTKITPTSSGN